MSIKTSALMASRLSVKQGGFSLIEALITVLIISVGLLSMATLQLQSIKLNRSALQKLQAANLANEIADTLFVNSQQAEDGDYTLAIGSQTNSAPSNTVAHKDIEQWLADVQQLPVGRLGISAAGTMAGVADIRTFDITICWQDQTVSVINGCGANQSSFTSRASSRMK
jgi:type IV pilus assembly protein PilV